MKAAPPVSVTAKPTTLDAYGLLHRGSLVMERMEHNGLRVDTRYLENTKEKILKHCGKLSSDLGKDPIYATWTKRFGQKTKLLSRAQLGTILFDVMKIPYPAQDRTEEGQWQTDVDVLEDIDLPFVRKYVELCKLLKCVNTYMANIAWETIDGICHPNFNLHLARTYRGTSDHPNFTNIPVRDAMIKKFVRRAIRARPGHRLVDLDFKGSEVNAAYWYHKDPVMGEYIRKDPGRMHFDAAKQLYMLTDALMTSEIRHCGKNMFVFPQFYGDWYISCARHLWKAIDRMHLKTKSGIPLKEWLRRQGITELGLCDPEHKPVPGTFEYNVREVERDFWQNRFKVYTTWKNEWWEKYQQQGWLQMLSGFQVSGLLNRKHCINYPIQGTAFHCLLWCLIRLQELLDRYHMKAMLVGQIHDDAVGDVPERELKDYVEIAQQVITIDLKKHWPWITTPMRVETEVTPVGGTWYQKEAYTG